MQKMDILSLGRAATYEIFDILTFIDFADSVQCFDLKD
tara:strand:- start:415 stop:528 length:114 start_codon:yes stop_codon:yes gene_type:complete